MNVINAIERFRLKTQIKRVRRELLFWGVDTSALTDDQLIEKLDEIQREFNAAVDAFRLTILEVTEGFRGFSEAMAKIDWGDFFPPADKDKLVIRVKPRE